MYGCEIWTLLKDERDRLQALEMWLWRGLEKISWNDKINNERVLKRLYEKIVWFQQYFKGRRIG